MADLFADYPEALAVSLVINKKCSFEMDFKTKHYPVYVPPHLEGAAVSPKERMQAAQAFLRELCEEGLKKRYTKEKLARVAEKYPGQDPMEVVRARLEYELGVIVPRVCPIIC